MISIFTRDLGLVFALAQGIRFEKSKLRSFTQDYSFGRFSFVRGKEYWRLTSAQEDNTNLRIYANDTNNESTNGTQTLIARIASLLERLLHGEQPNPELFDCIYSCQLFIGENPRLNDESLQTLESLIVVRILNRLGYIGDAAELNDRIQSTELAIELLDNLKSSRATINKHINKALKESHL
jgi:recombinational DNA repair protein (RecF pathway)